jgi:hypothetical protein
MLEELSREMGQWQDEERSVELIAETFGTWIQQMKSVNNTSQLEQRDFSETFVQRTNILFSLQTLVDPCLDGPQRLIVHLKPFAFQCLISCCEGAKITKICTQITCVSW